MPLHSLIARFLVRFVVVYGLLILPWNGWSDLYGAGFREVGDSLFGRHDDKAVIDFQPHRETSGLGATDSRILVGNPRKAGANGTGPAMLLDLDTRSIGWIPTALTLALITASPVPWRRRGLALLWGLLLVHLYIAFVIWVYIYNESTAVELHALGPFWKSVASEAEYTLVTQLGASFTVPVLIWLLVTFRARDRELLFPTRKKRAAA